MSRVVFQPLGFSWFFFFGNSRVAAQGEKREKESDESLINSFSLLPSSHLFFFFLFFNHNLDILSFKVHFLKPSGLTIICRRPTLHSLPTTTNKKHSRPSLSLQKSNRFENPNSLKNSKHEDFIHRRLPHPCRGCRGRTK